MQTEMKKLVVLAELALHKNTLIPVTQTEFLHTLNRQETGLDKQPFSNISPQAVKNNLLYTSEVLAGWYITSAIMHAAITAANRVWL